MRLNLAVSVACILLSGCYVANQSKFEDAVHSWIKVDMPVTRAASILGTHGLICDGLNPTHCTRGRGGLQPYTCVERVSLKYGGSNMLIDEIVVPQIACTGL
jgi:hypothetical protein